MYNREKVETLCEMAFAVAGGNFSYRIARSDHDDGLESLVVSMNMMAEEIREIFHHFALVNPHESYKQMAQMTFILDESFQIRNFNHYAQQLLGLKPAEIKGKSLADFMTGESQAKWAEEILKISQSEVQTYFHTIRIFFTSGKSLTIPALCSVSSLVLEKDLERLYFVTALHTIVQSREKEQIIQEEIKNLRKQRNTRKKHHQAVLRNETDRRKVEEIHQVILSHPEMPLPSLRELAHAYGTNEFKLKTGFRQYYNTSVFRFQKQERLKRAHHLIVDTDLPLMQVAEISGFKNFPHFSKIFKKRYGYNPSYLRNRNYI